jgi:hypothetical protein
MPIPVVPGPVDPLTSPDDSTSLADGHYVDVIILNRIMALLTGMIQTLQEVGIAQAQRLSFLTQWQQAYTDEMNQIHAFVKGNGDGIDGGGSDDAQTRNDLNQVNSTYTEQIRANNSTLSDTAKALQSNLNSTNDAQQQQASLATQILQQMSTILSSIFR